MPQDSSTLTGSGRNQVELSYLVGDDTWKVAKIEVSEKPATGLIRTGKLEVIVDVKTQIPKSERDAVIQAIERYHQRTYKTKSYLTINFD